MRMTGWHGTTKDFDGFSEEAFGSAADRSPNGALGVWAFTGPDHASSFGGRVLELDIAAEKVVRRTVTQMMKDHHAAGSDREEAVAFFRGQRQEWLRQGFQLLEVVEYDGRVDMIVVLDLACIENVREMSGPKP